MKRIKGFTLIELIIVIAIISLLAMIITYSIVGAQQKARDTKRIAELSDIGKAIGIYQSMNAGKLPVSGAGNNYWDTGCIEDNNFLNDLTVEGLAKTIPRSTDIPDPSGFGYPGAGCYRYRYFDPTYGPTGNGVCNDGSGYGVLYTACESKTCPTGEIERDCPYWKDNLGWEEGWQKAGTSENIDNQVYMIFIKGN
ncbi:MAG TPA: prepilin-type N-terminal cleavage/methylation domain-containing protein [Candidatus Pacearchaeota archaeon]|nr:prepilin-type N-terminal cleavage/methylation domain-containing protein [Candidatus Pacearchaeota archaeon]